MAVNPLRYRSVQFIGGRILESRELNTLQNISQGISSTGTQTSSELGAIYRQGAMLNAEVSVSGQTVSIVPIVSTLPIQVFVRDRWETFQSTELVPITLSAGQEFVFLNWQLAVVTSDDDPTLVDGATGQPTAEMGQLYLQLSNIDNSSAPLTSSQLAKNTSPIILAAFQNTNGVLTYYPIDNVIRAAHASTTSAGLVTVTTGNTTAVSTDDARMSNARGVIDGGVHDASVRQPAGTGVVNADGTPGYDLNTDIGGINAAKIILQNTTQSLADAWTWLKNSFNSLLNRYNAHEGIVLGLSNTHPFPSPSQVGAAPLSHVGLPLNLPNSHPATATQSSGGFSLNRVPSPDGSYPAAVNDAGFGIYQASRLVSGLNHNGDVFSSLANEFIATPGGSPLTYAGALGLMSNLAAVVRDHVNQTSNANPHGITLADLGGFNGTTQAYVDNGDANTLAAAKAYSVSIATNLTVSTVAVSGGKFVIFRFAPNPLSGIGAVEIAFGSGVASHGTVIPLPNGNYSYSNMLSLGVSINAVGISQNTVNTISVSMVNGNTISCQVANNNGSVQHGFANWSVLFWRTNA